MRPVAVGAILDKRDRIVDRVIKAISSYSINAPVGI
jgi:hypothetical protein